MPGFDRRQTPAAGEWRRAPSGRLSTRETACSLQSSTSDDQHAVPAPFNSQKACRHGQMLYNVHDTYIGRSLDLYGEFSEGEIELFRQFVKPGDRGARRRRQHRHAHAVLLPGRSGQPAACSPSSRSAIVFQTSVREHGPQQRHQRLVPPAGGRGRARRDPRAAHSTPSAMNNFGGLGLGPPPRRASRCRS